LPPERRYEVRYHDQSPLAGSGSGLHDLRAFQFPVRDLRFPWPV